ncbi:Rrf2 family transcriptional regulator [Vibrio diazotrophicus]|uniref:Rrf2 family transcriptional regulator n=1 Tax=Vibrio diazotrophicus TaxID=685 RepID=UPI000C9DFD4E|nr:Rrf2 family transcriptional regulator [Vibrio diazotrophicus]PNH91299.1 Rrf2 family transcriptional regulator [Vibrio diazotrophicus]
MRTDSRLSRVIHALLHMHDTQQPLTSEVLAKMLNTNSSVIRRTMSGLRDKGYVMSSKGHHGGWVLTKPLEDITLLELYEALGMPRLFAISSESDNSTCLVQQIADESLNNALEISRHVFIAQLEKVTLAELNKQFKYRLQSLDNGRVEKQGTCKRAEECK